MLLHRGLSLLLFVALLSPVSNLILEGAAVIRLCLVEGVTLGRLSARSATMSTILPVLDLGVNSRQMISRDVWQFEVRYQSRSTPLRSFSKNIMMLFTPPL